MNKETDFWLIDAFQEGFPRTWAPSLHLAKKFVKYHKLAQANIIHVRTVREEEL